MLSLQYPDHPRSTPATTEIRPADLRNLWDVVVKASASPGRPARPRRAEPPRPGASPGRAPAAGPRRGLPLRLRRGARSAGATPFSSRRPRTTSARRIPVASIRAWLEPLGLTARDGQPDHRLLRAARGQAVRGARGQRRRSRARRPSATTWCSSTRTCPASRTGRRPPTEPRSCSAFSLARCAPLPTSVRWAGSLARPRSARLDTVPPAWSTALREHADDAGAHSGLRSPGHRERRGRGRRGPRLGRGRRLPGRGARSDVGTGGAPSRWRSR